MHNDFSWRDSRSRVLRTSRRKTSPRLTLSLGRSLQQQETAPADEKRAIFHAGQVAISNFSHIDGFTAIDTIAEDDVQVVYHRDQQGKWNVVTLLEALAGEQTDAGATEDSDKRGKNACGKGCRGHRKGRGTIQRKRGAGNDRRSSPHCG